MIAMNSRMSAAIFIATVAGIGHSSRAPGTLASIAAGLLAVIVVPLVPVAHLQIVVIALALFFAALGFAVCPASVRHFSVSDPQQVVIDEVAGVWWALAVIPAGLLHEFSLMTIVVAVAFFRVFDIAKPWPVGWLEHLPGPSSIMADDLAAGVIAGLITTAILF